MAALKILQNGDVAPSAIIGSWAGAMGHTQFIPTSYLQFAVDFNGDGRRDVWSDDPTDALASTAAYLQRSNWIKGPRWGGEVTGTATGSVIQPQSGGPRLETTANFRAIKRRNNSDDYAIGVGHPADRIGGAGPLQSAFPPDIHGLTKADRIFHQQWLTARGFDMKGSDGILGANTEAAMRAFQSSRGLPVSGSTSQSLLPSCSDSDGHGRNTMLCQR